MTFLFGVIAAAYDNSVPPPPPPPPPPPTCTPTCGACSYTYGDWSAWSTCVDGTQTRTRTVTCTQVCTASDCSTYTQTSTTTETESQACAPTVTWYCTTAFGSNYTSSTDVSFTGECNETVACSTSGYPSPPPC
jgi:hypothetical protein